MKEDRRPQKTASRKSRVQPKRRYGAPRRRESKGRASGFGPNQRPLFLGICGYFQLIPTYSSLFQRISRCARPSVQLISGNSREFQGIPAYSNVFQLKKFFLGAQKRMKTRAEIAKRRARLCAPMVQVERNNLKCVSCSSISSYFDLFRGISIYLVGRFRAISRYFDLFRAISTYFDLFRDKKISPETNVTNEHEFNPKSRVPSPESNVTAQQALAQDERRWFFKVFQLFSGFFTLETV